MKLLNKSQNKVTKLNRFLDYWWRVKKNWDWSVPKEGIPTEFSNKDFILCKIGCIIRKTWEVENTGKDTWPSNTVIRPEIPKMDFLAPTIDVYVDPGDRVRITIIFKIHEENIKIVSQFVHKVIEFKFILWSTKDGRFGEPLRVYLEINEDRFDREWKYSTSNEVENELSSKIDKQRVWIDQN